MIGILVTNPHVMMYTSLWKKMFFIMIRILEKSKNIKTTIKINENEGFYY